MDWDGKQPRFKNFPRSAPQPGTFRINGNEYLRVVFGLGPDDYDYPTCFCGAARNTPHILGCRFEPPDATNKRSPAIASTNATELSLRAATNFIDRSLTV